MENLDKTQSIVKSILLHTHQQFLPLLTELKTKYHLLFPAAYAYSKWFNRYRLSMAHGKHGKNGKCFYDGRHYYIATKYDKFKEDLWLPNGRGTINKIIQKLVDTGLIIKTRKEHYMQIRIVKWENIINYGISVPTKSTKFNNRTPRYSKNEQIYKGHVSKPRSNSTDNTFNTDNGRKRTFEKSDSLDDWVNSAHSKRGGLTLGAVNCIAGFCSKSFINNPVDHCKHIYNIIAVARNYEVKYSNQKINKDLIPFECNGKVRSSLESKLRKVFTKVINSRSNKLSLNHYSKYLMTSLENFFHTALGLGKQKVVTPESKIDYQNSNNHGYIKRKPEIEHKPKWLQDEEAGKTPKPKKTDKLLTNLIQARNAYDIVAMQANDPIKPNPNHDKMAMLKEQRDHCQKLYNDKQEASRPKQHKQSEKLPKTDPVLQRRIRIRLRRLGEE